MRYLRPVQLYGRIWFRLYRPLPDCRPAPSLRPVARVWPGPAWRPASMTGPETFVFLNRERSLPEGVAGWNDPAVDKLWLYNLHYFDDLNAEGATERIDWHRPLLRRWLAENQPGMGNGWEPYPLSLRLVNWVKWLSRRPCPASDERDSDGVANSMAVQARWLRRRLEHHLLGNHLFANAKALVFAGAFFVGAEADGWLLLGQGLLARELREQVLKDGGHFELSPMYHAIFLEDLLDLLALAQVYPGALHEQLLAECREAAGRMLAWLAVMTHPDGELALFNDAAFGIAPRLSQLAAYAATAGVEPDWGDGSGDGGARNTVTQAGNRQGSRTADDLLAGGGAAGGKPANKAAVSVWWLPDSGYLRLAAGPAVALLDIAAIGPDYLPGHAHADTLSFELSLFGRRVVVNGGTSQYGVGPQRLAERGTAAHSTVQIDDADSSEVWGGFRVARRARVVGREIVQELKSGNLPKNATITASHDGYRRLPGRPLHQRSWHLQGNRLVIRDTIKGRFTKAVARFHLHPAIRVEQYPTGNGVKGRLKLPTGQTITWRATGAKVTITTSQWHPEFGRSINSQTMELHISPSGVTSGARFVKSQHSECQLEIAW